MIRRSEKALGTAFYVPNDEKGREFIKNLQFYLNRKCYKLRIRGRNENRHQYHGQSYKRKMRDGSGHKIANRHRITLRQDIPHSLSTYFAIYVNSRAHEIVGRLYQEVNELRKTVGKLKSEKVTLTIEEGERLNAQLETLLETITKQRKIHL